jgi:hypothetical protein
LNTIADLRWQNRLANRDQIEGTTEASCLCYLDTGGLGLGITTGEKPQSFVTICRGSVAQLLRLWGWTTQSLRYPTHADAITASRRRPFCLEVPAVSGK